MDHRTERTGRVVLAHGWSGCGGVDFRLPRELFVARRIDDVRPALAAACEAAASGLHVAGFLAYEAAPAFDQALRVKPADTPLVWLAAYDERRPWSPPSAAGETVLSDVRFAYDGARYTELVAVLRGHIREGDVYQVNLTGPLGFSLRGDPYDLFEELLERHPVPYAAFVDTGRVSIVSCSPELFFQRIGSRVRTRPMKGTVRRGRSAEEDEALAGWLARDEKSRAENLMIVDLLRNDLARCCEPGTVRVSSLFDTERYETVIQMTSEIEGRLRAGAATEDVFAALFPCGSVTGAPKVRAMDLIAHGEQAPRGVYCGAVGYMHRDQAVFNVAIRTAEIRGALGRLGIGSGIVWDSDAASEYDECLLKARFLTDLEGPASPAEEALPDLIETMRAVDGEIPLFDLHLDRIRTSSKTLGYPFDEAEFRRRIADATPAVNAHKIRAALAPSGRMDVAVCALQEARPAEWRAKLAETRINSSDLYRRHKTTRRRLYDEAYEAAQAEGFDEVIFLNERGEVAEGSRTNVVAVVGERWLTPPERSGALPGVYRRHLRETRDDVEEAVLKPADLRRADAVFLCNAVRGLVRTHILLAPDLYREDVTSTPGSHDQ